jgi:hypothetical protein
VLRPVLVKSTEVRRRCRSLLPDRIHDSRGNAETAGQ